MLHFQDEAQAPAQGAEAPAQGAAPQHPLRVSLSDEEGDIINDTAGVEAAAAAAAAKKKRGRPAKNKK